MKDIIQELVEYYCLNRVCKLCHYNDKENHKCKLVGILNNKGSDLK